MRVPISLALTSTLPSECLRREDELPDDMSSQAREAEPKMTMSKQQLQRSTFPSDYP